MKKQNKKSQAKSLKNKIVTAKDLKNVKGGHGIGPFDDGCGNSR